MSERGSGRAFDGLLGGRVAKSASGDGREASGARRFSEEGLFVSVGVFAVGAHEEAVIGGEDGRGKGRGRRNISEGSVGGRVEATTVGPIATFDGEYRRNRRASIVCIRGRQVERAIGGIGVVARFEGGAISLGHILDIDILWTCWR